MRLSAEVFARFVGDIAQFVKDTALLDHAGAVHLGHGGSEFAFAIPNDCLQSGFWPHTPFPDTTS
jgi:hypothetical protein